MIPGSNKDHPSFLRSFGYAIEGFVTAVRTERNIKVMLAAGVPRLGDAMIPGSNKDHPSFLRSFGYAIEGFVTAVRTERNIKVMLAAGVLTVIMGFVAKLQLISWALIVICIGLVIFAELCNTAMEAIVDLATQELHPLAKRAKDIAAASVYVLSITAAIVGVLVFAHAFGFFASWH